MTEKIKMATREAYGKALAALAGEMPELVVLDADLSGSTKTKEFAKVAPERFINCGIAEADMIGVACGLASCGKVPFASSFAVFAAGRAFEQIRNSVCYGRQNVKIAATHAGITVGEDGGTHQAVEDIAIMRALPGMTVLVPSDWVQATWAVRAAAAYKGPVYLRLGRLAAPQVYEEDQQFAWGKGLLARPGRDIVIFACGMMVAEALTAAGLLAEEGIDAAVADIHTVKPLDSEFVLAQAQACGAALTVEEHTVLGGLGSAVAETLADAGLGLPFARLGLQDQFGQSGKPADLLRYYGLDGAAIAERAKAVLARK
ncbi:MAG: transketolase family protein [Firmicutes bacterium]|nr:transketolase family protein [Bacillota bacterium]